MLLSFKKPTVNRPLQGQEFTREGLEAGGWKGVCKVTTQDTENFDEELQPLASASQPEIPDQAKGFLA